MAGRKLQNVRPAILLLSMLLSVGRMLVAQPASEIGTPATQENKPPKQKQASHTEGDKKESRGNTKKKEKNNIQKKSSKKDEIIIEAPRMDKDEPDPTASTTTIYTSDYEGRPLSVADVLEREASVRVRRYGGRGSYSTLSLRGSNPNQVNLFIDGIPITGAAQGTLDLSDLNLDAFERIEVYRSGSYPGSPIGGTVNLVTKKSAPKESGGQAKATAGSHKTAGLSLDYEGGESLYYYLNARGEVSDQDYKFLNHNGTPLINKYDDFIDLRKNAWYKNAFGTITLGYQTKNTEYFFLNDTALRYQGVPGPIPRQSEKVKRRKFRNTTGLGFDRKALFAKNFRLQGRIYYSAIYDSYFDPKQEFSANQPGSKSRYQLYGLHLAPELTLPEYYQTFRLYLATEREAFRRDRRNKDDVLLAREPTRFRNHHTARLSDKFAFWKERIFLTPSAEYQRYVDVFNEEARYLRLTDLKRKTKNITELSNYRLGAKALLVKQKKFEFYLKGSASTGSRTALFLELFGERGSIIGNTDLRPERAVTGEGGFGLSGRRRRMEGSLEAIAFHKSVRDMILLVPNSRFSLRPENIDSADIRGLELTSQARLFSMLKFYLNYTFQRAINTSNAKSVRGKYLPLRPLHEGQGGLTWFTEGLESGLEAVYVGAVFRNRTNEPTSYVRPRWSYNFFINWKVWQNDGSFSRGFGDELQVGLEIRNLQNRLYTDVTEYPLPGRTAYVTLLWKF